MSWCEKDKKDNRKINVKDLMKHLLATLMKKTKHFLVSDTLMGGVLWVNI